MKVYKRSQMYILTKKLFNIFQCSDTCMIIFPSCLVSVRTGETVRIFIFFKSWGLIVLCWLYITSSRPFKKNILCFSNYIRSNNVWLKYQRFATSVSNNIEIENLVCGKKPSFFVFFYVKKSFFNLIVFIRIVIQRKKKKARNPT